MHLIIDMEWNRNFTFVKTLMLVSYMSKHLHELVASLDAIDLRYHSNLTIKNDVYFFLQSQTQILSLWV